MTYLLDTDHVSVLQSRSGSDRATLVANLNLHTDTEIGVSIVTFHEQSRGCHNFVNTATASAGVVRGYEMFQRLFEVLQRFRLVPFDSAAAAEFERLRLLKLRVGTMDLRLAATALNSDLVVVTRNVSDFGKIPGLRTEDWTR